MVSCMQQGSMIFNRIVQGVAMGARICKSGLSLIVSAFLAAMLLPVMGAAFAQEAPDDNGDVFAPATTQSLTAQATPDSGTWGECSWTLDKNGVMTVMPGAAGDISSAPWKSHSDVTSVVFKPLDGAQVTGVTYLSGCFAGCRNLSSVDLSGLDTSNVTTTEGMFRYCTALKTFEIDGLDLSNVTTMLSMFENCTSLTNVKIVNVDTPKLKTMSSMFSVCTNLNSVDLSGLDTKYVTRMNYIFNQCYKLTSADLSNFDFSNLETLEKAFYYCQKLESVDLPRTGSPKLQVLDRAFDHCTTVRSLDLSGLTTPSLRSMLSVFESCEYLENVDLSSFRTSNVTNMSGLFNYCRSLARVDVSYFDTSSVTDIYDMFSNMTSLEELDISYFDLRSLRREQQIVNGCTSLKLIRVGLGFRFILGFPNVSLFGHEDWFSVADKQWYTSQEIYESRQKIADTYRKWSNKIADADVNIPAQRYTGLPVEPKPKVTAGGNTLTEDVDYEIVGYADNVELGDEAKVTIRGIREFEGVRTVNFTIAEIKPTWTRLAGSSRYATMPLIVGKAFPGTCKWAVVVSGADKNFPDALSAAALEGARNCPVITTAPDALSGAARNQLVRLGVKNVIIVGGTGAVSRTCETQIATALGEGGIVKRIAGSTRYQTSQLVMEAASALRAPETVFIATGTEFADALSAGPWSYANGAPIVLTNPKTGPTDDQIAAIKATGAMRAVVLGGEKAVPAGTEARLEAAGISAERVSGSNRYATSAALARWSMANGEKLGTSGPVLATGMKSADALAGAALAASRNSVILLADEKDAKGKARYSVALAFLEQNKASLEAGYFLGGKNAVAPALAERIVAATDAVYHELS